MPEARIVAGNFGDGEGASTFLGRSWWEPGQRIVPRNPLLEADITEHHVLLLIVSTHISFLPHSSVETCYLVALPPNDSLSKL